MSSARPSARLWHGIVTLVACLTLLPRLASANFSVTWRPAALSYSFLEVKPGEKVTFKMSSGQSLW